tara:strand:- start:251 stop:451 length:201 start_codon:yes stop_codon:yes gene_type:complete
VTVEDVEFPFRFALYLFAVDAFESFVPLYYLVGEALAFSFWVDFFGLKNMKLLLSVPVGEMLDLDA